MALTKTTIVPAKSLAKKDYQGRNLHLSHLQFHFHIQRDFKRQAGHFKTFLFRPKWMKDMGQFFFRPNGNAKMFLDQVWKFANESLTGRHFFANLEKPANFDRLGYLAMMTT